MNEYEAKQEARRERYEARAGRADQESDAQYERSRQITEHIPFGQPILVGHHSEGRHRRDLNRSWRAMEKSAEASKKAEHYRQKAAGVGKGGISSDDPDAIEKLREKLAKLEEVHAKHKKINAYYRKHKTVKGLDGIIDKTADLLDINAAEAWDKKPIPAYEFSNRNGNMGRIKERIKELEASADEPEGETIEGEGYTIEESKEINRVKFIFDAKPQREVCKLLRSQGWRWSRTEMAWLRHLNNGGRHSAKYCANLIDRDHMLA